MGASILNSKGMSELETDPDSATISKTSKPSPSAAKNKNGLEKPRRVLLVDDHATTRSLLRILLEEHPEIEVVAEASDGDEAIVLAEMYRPDIILMDIQLPRVNGVEATRHIHKNLPQIVIIGVSSQYTHHGYNAMMAAGAVAFVGKEDAVSALYKTIQFGLHACPTRTLSHLASLEQKAADVNCSVRDFPLP